MYRLLTALILIPLVLAILFFTPYYVFVGANALAIVVAGWEWANLSKIKSIFFQLFFLVLLVGALVASFWVPYRIIWLAGWWWMLAIVGILSFGMGKKLIPFEKFMIPVGLLTLVPTFVSLNILREKNPELVLWLFLFIWGADSLAYFVGKKFGKHKLIPRVSPNKTWEGFVAAILVCVLVGILASFRHFGGSLKSWIIIAIVVGLASVFGDLFESLIKRSEGVKDSGSILPGHGGLLDRIDSLTAAGPIFALIVLCFAPPFGGSCHEVTEGGFSKVIAISIPPSAFGTSPLGGEEKI